MRRDNLVEHASVDQEDMDIIFPAARTHDETTRLEWRSDEELREWHNIKMSNGHMSKTINGFSISTSKMSTILAKAFPFDLTPSCLHFTTHL